jgi:hypothetical protein
MEQSEEDIIYYNINQRVNYDINGNPVPFAPVEFSTTRADNIIDNPSEYEVAVARFSVPGLFVPIFLLDDPPDAVFVELAFGTNTYRQTVQYVPRTTNPTPYFPRAIWNVNEYIEGINNALNTAFQALKVDYPSHPATDPPQLVFDAPTQLCSLYAEVAYQDQRQTGITTIEVRFNEYLYNQFPSFQAFQYSPGSPQNPLPSNQDLYKILILQKGFGVNVIDIQGTNYIQMEQENTTIPLWNEFNNLIFESDSIPINNELLPTTTNSTRSILTDFNLPESLNDRTDIQFQADGLELRWNTMTSQTPLKTIDIKAFWESDAGVLYPVFIPRFNSFSLKLVFRRRRKYQKETERIGIDYNLGDRDINEVKKKIIDDIVSIENRRGYKKQTVNDPLYKIDYDKQKEEVNKDLPREIDDKPKLDDNSISLPAKSNIEE